MDTEEINETEELKPEADEISDAETVELKEDDFIPIIDIPEAYIISNIDDAKKTKIHVIKGLTKALFTPEFYFAVLLSYQELLFHLFRFGFKAENLSFKILFAVFYGIVTGALVSVFPKLASIILTFVFTAFFTIYFLTQIVFSGVFGTYLSLSGSIGVANQALDFTDVIFKELKEEWYILVLMIIPLILLSVYLRKKINFERHKIYMYAMSVGAAVLTFVVIMIGMQAGRKKVYSTFEVYRDYTSVDMSVEKLGVIESFYLDTKVGIKEKFGIKNDKVSFVAEAEEEITTEEITTEQIKKEDTPEEVVIDRSPNILDIDFDALMESAPNENIRAMHEYISQVKPTNKNEYTGMFEGYNLIFVVAEGFYGLSIDQTRTPMLYKMKYGGFCFDNYYSPLWYGSTLGGEYANLTGLMPRNGGYLAMSKSGFNKNDMMFTLSRELLDKGYKVTGYHNNDYTYYDRNVSHPNLGYDWIGVGNGFEPEYGPGGNMLWPQSDEYMIEKTFDEYADDEPFHTYYLTVSGHVMYNFSGNAMSKKHMEMVEDMDYSETTKAYIACQYELELAMEKLVDKLEEKGIADNTLIVLAADHVPYDNKDVCDELAGHTLDSTFEWFENTLIIWSPSMEKPVYVEKCCSSLDILPTVLNLMGLPYDSRMIAGQDALSDSEGLGMFNDRSFITDRISYNANTGEVKSLDGKPVDEDYVEAKVAQVRNKFNMAEKICDYDYYRYIDEYLKGE